MKTVVSFFDFKKFFIGAGVGLLILSLFFVGKSLGPKQKLLETYPPVSNSSTPLIKRRNVPILMYHYVEYNKDSNDTIRVGLTVSPYWFEKQLLALKSAGYETISLDEIFTTNTRKPIILTFDDGYRDFYTDAYPLLKRYNMKATVYLVVNFLDRPNYLTTDMVKIIATDSAGLITFGSHTLNHQNLTQIPQNRAYDEVAGSKDRLEKIIKAKVNHFCYPYGAFNQANVDMVKSAGYLTATTTLPGTTHYQDYRLELKRLRIGNNDGESFLRRLTIP